MSLWAAKAQENSPSTALQADTLTTQFADIPIWSTNAAVSTIKGQKLEKSFTQNVLNTLYGEIPGLTVVSNGGDPGSDSPTINARGFNTLETTDRSVLVLVDGFESNLENLSVQEIESVTLIKDAAAAVYGMRAANGVLLVKTKRGSVKPLEVNFSAQAGFNTPITMPKFLDSYNYALLYDEARRNDGLAPVYEGTPALDAYKNGTDPYLYPNVNWYDEVLKNVSAMQNYNLNFSGGNKVARYFALVNVSDNNGFFKGTDSRHQINSNSKYTRYNVRANVDINIIDNLSATALMSANIIDQYAPAGGAWNMYNNLALIPSNSFPVYNPDGSYGGNATFSNPVGNLLETGFNSYNARNLQSILKLKYDFRGVMKGLSLSAGMSFNSYFVGNSNHSRKYPYYMISYADGQYVYNQYSEETSMTVDDSQSTQWRTMNYLFSANYLREFKNRHRVTADLEFFSDEIYKEKNTSLKDYQFPYRYLGLRGGASYSYDKKYVTEFMFSWQGSDLYPSSGRFGFFPAGTLGWILSNEDFLKDNDVLSYLKLRATYGLVGNASIVGAKRYAYLQDYRYSASYYKGKTQTSVSGIMEDEVADVNRTWEKEKRLNIGADFTFANKINMSFDWFLHKRSDILVPATAAIPGVLGMTFSSLNLGRTTNTGFELALSYNDKIGSDFEHKLTFKSWYAKNRIDYQAEEIRQYPNLVRTGLAIGQPFGLKAIGLFKDEADIASSPEHTFSDVRPGDIKYEDVNGDDKIDNQDVCAIGKTSTPTFTGSLTYGFKWKNLDFETMFYGVAGRSIYLSGNTYWSFMNQYGAPESALGRWTEETKETAEYPRLSTMANQNNTQYSSFWQRNGSFLKLKYVEVGYTFPFNLSKSDKNLFLRLYVNGTNLLSIHGLHGLANADPEGVSGVPSVRTVSGGVKLTF